MAASASIIKNVTAHIDETIGYIQLGVPYWSPMKKLRAKILRWVWKILEMNPIDERLMGLEKEAEFQRDLMVKKQLWDGGASPGAGAWQ